MSYTQPDARQPKTWRQRLMLVLMTILFLWMFALLPLSCVSMGAEHPVDLRWATCQITEATAEHTNDAEHPWRIVLESEDCPTLVYTDGLNEDNVDALVSTFEQAPYEVWVHESAVDAEGGIRYAKELKIHSYRPAPETAS